MRTQIDEDMELDFTALNRIKENTAPATEAENKRPGEYTFTPGKEKLTEALKRAKNEAPEIAAYPDEDLTQYTEELREPLRAMMIMEYIADNIRGLDLTDIIGLQARALSLIMEPGYIDRLLERL